MKRVHIIRQDDDETELLFRCPGCGENHWVKIGGDRRPRWKWNGSLGEPTIQPTLLVKTDRHRCHAMIFNGYIGYLNGSTHHLAGQTIELPRMDLRS